MIYFKQYGAERSGTNYLKRLLELNFEGITVFGSVLGWKHGMYETGNGYRFKCSSHEEWIKEKTKNDKVYSVDNHPLPYTIEELENACKELKYLISVKDPYSYVVSYKKFRAKKQPWELAKVIKWLNQYVVSYDRWQNLYNNNPGNSYIINYDCLTTNKDVILNSIKCKFGLQPIHTDYVDEKNTINASTDHGLLIGRQTFNKNYYINKEYMNELPENIKAVITNTLHHTQLLRC